MKFFLLFNIAILLSSCFFFKDLKKDRFSFKENGVEQHYSVVIPKGFKSREMKIDSAGNEAQFYYYADGAVLYFVKVKDTNFSYQLINYEENLPKELYHTIYFKGVESGYGHYWRESRFDGYKAGYYKVESDEDWKFDSAVNYFSLRSVKPVQ